MDSVAVLILKERKARCERLRRVWSKIRDPVHACADGDRRIERHRHPDQHQRLCDLDLELVAECGVDGLEATLPCAGVCVVAGL
eukprot:7390175-Prymnesium_polylepis.1